MAWSKTPEIQVGSKINHLTLLEVIRKDGGPFGLFLCDCSATKVIRMRDVWPRENTKSCGCVRGKLIAKSQTKHGFSTRAVRAPEHYVWNAMRQRCNNKNSGVYKYYGGRGIKVDPRWDSFENFLSDMGRRPSDKHTIERINNDLGYGPSNCKWATMAEQNMNKRAKGTA